MLRAIGAQIEKTTNKDACRDLSGRRLRDVNAEKRLKEYIARQAKRQQLQREKRRQKLACLRRQPTRTATTRILSTWMSVPSPLMSWGT